MLLYETGATVTHTLGHGLAAGIQGGYHDAAFGYGPKSGSVAVNGRTFSMHTLTTAGGIVDADHTVVVRIQHCGTHQTQVLSFALTLDDQGTQFSQYFI
jgi:hypothetical protein